MEFFWWNLFLSNVVNSSAVSYLSLCRIIFRISTCNRMFYASSFLFRTSRPFAFLLTTIFRHLYKRSIIIFHLCFEVSIHFFIFYMFIRYLHISLLLKLLKAIFSHVFYFLFFLFYSYWLYLYIYSEFHFSFT